MSQIKITGNPTLELWMNGIAELGKCTEINTSARFLVNFISNSVVINDIELCRIEFPPANQPIVLYDFFSPEQYRQAGSEQSAALMEEATESYTPYIVAAPDNTERLIIAPIITKSQQQLLLEIQVDEYQEENFTYLPFLIQAFVNNFNLVDLNSRDSLTGLLNQRNYNEKIEQYVSVSDNSINRRESPVSHCLAVVDLDHFKKINDRYGHLFGDDILIHIAKILTESFRHRDLVFRFSGEKFIIIINEVSMQDAHAILNRLRQKIASYEFPLDIKLTTSIGFTTLMGGTPDVLFDHAEKALYYAKEHGRNKVYLYEDLEQQGLLAEPAEDDSNIDFF